MTLPKKVRIVEVGPRDGPRDGRHNAQPGIAAAFASVMHRLAAML